MNEKNKALMIKLRVHNYIKQSDIDFGVIVACEL